MLNSDQEKTLKYVKRWWASPSMYTIINGKGGVGKSFLVEAILKTLPKCDPILIAPTNEALSQLRNKLKANYTYKTVASSLGITPTTHKKELTFEHRSMPGFWNNFNLCVLDESSMVDNLELDLLISIGIKILFIGHKSQLPPIVKNRKIKDLCISPVFDQGWEESTLTIPMRNTGSLWEFNTIVEEMIYDKSIKLPTSFDIKGKDMRGYLSSVEGKDDLLLGDTKVVMWSNHSVDTYNRNIRTLLFGEYAKRNTYLPQDRIILTKPLTLIPDLERYSSPNLLSLVNSRDDLDFLYSNCKAVVIKSIVIQVTLLPNLTFACHKIQVKCEGKVLYLYDIVSQIDRDRIADYYEHLAWNSTTKEARTKMYKNRHFILSCFANVKHYFAATSHRLQGSSVKNVIVTTGDIERNPCIVERSKCRYVATSRVEDHLMVYRGL